MRHRNFLEALAITPLLIALRRGQTTQLNINTLAAEGGSAVIETAAAGALLCSF